MDLKTIDSQKKNILTDLLVSEYDDYSNDSDMCTICFNTLDNPVCLDCNHKFCYNCLLESYRGTKCNFYLKNHRISPYCRHPSNYLPLMDGYNPIKGIHREYGKKKTQIFTRCSAIIKSGPNKGKKCGCKVKSVNSLFCGRHKEKTS